MSMTIPSPTVSTENPLSPESDEGALPSINYMELEAPAGIEQPFFGKAIESPQSIFARKCSSGWQRKQFWLSSCHFFQYCQPVHHGSAGVRRVDVGRVYMDARFPYPGRIVIGFAYTNACHILRRIGKPYIDVHSTAGCSCQWPCIVFS
jgi:hypothetical protein